MENPNSVKQIKDWFSENGLETDTLGKKAVAELLKTAPKPLAGVGASSATGKVISEKVSGDGSGGLRRQACQRAVQYYGANRTGRAAGRLIQCQNLPQNHMADLEQARSLVRSGDFTTLDLLYDNVPAVLSELIRTAFIPRTGASSSSPTSQASRRLFWPISRAKNGRLKPTPKNVTYISKMPR